MKRLSGQCEKGNAGHSVRSSRCSLINCKLDHHQQQQQQHCLQCVCLVCQHWTEAIMSGDLAAIATIVFRLLCADVKQVRQPYNTSKYCNSGNNLFTKHKSTKWKRIRGQIERWGGGEVMDRRGRKERTNERRRRKRANGKESGNDQRRRRRSVERQGINWTRKWGGRQLLVHVGKRERRRAKRTEIEIDLQQSEKSQKLEVRAWAKSKEHEQHCSNNSRSRSSSSAINPSVVYGSMAKLGIIMDYQVTEQPLAVVLLAA